MATFEDRIRLVVDAVTGGAARDMRALRAEVAAVEGPAAKAKTTLAGLGTVIRNNVGFSVAAAGTALTTFAVKAVSDFTNLGVAVGNLAAVSGLTTEQASRLVEVADDLGVSADTLTTAFTRLNRAGASGALAKIGINATDANERFLQTIDYLARLTDETKQAEAGTQLLGRSWTSLAPLIEAAGTLREQLAAVSNTKALTPAEVARAQEMRDAFKDLQDVAEDLSLTVGQDLVPSLTALAGVVRDLNSLGVPKVVNWALKTNPFGLPVTMLEKGRDLVFGSNTTPTPAPTSSTTVVNNYPTGTDPRAVNRSLQDYYRRNGTKATGG